MEQIKTSRTKTGLKVFKYQPGLDKWMHLKTVKCKYEPIIKNLDWISDYKYILPTEEERLLLEMKLQISVLDWPNEAQRELVNGMEPCAMRRIELRNGDSYPEIIMSDGTNTLTVAVSKSIETMAKHYGIPFQTLKRNYRCAG